MAALAEMERTGGSALSPIPERPQAAISTIASVSSSPSTRRRTAEFYGTR